MPEGNLLGGLNPQQTKAITSVDTPLRVIAGAGSGKTMVIVRKVAYLIELGFSPQSIAAITFTNKAAQEMLTRLKALLPKEYVRQIQISTFHALGLKIIHSSPSLFGLRSNFSLLNAFDSKQLIKDIAGGQKSDLFNGIVSCIDHWKNEGVSPQQALNLASDEMESFAAISFSEYERQKDKLNMLDFSDLLLKPLFFLNSNAPEAVVWKNRFQYLLIDEYQDTNRTQDSLFCCLADQSQRFTIVGDTDQSIYAWRGALPDNMADITNRFPKIKTIILSQNYRSTNNILRAANRLISSIDSSDGAPETKKLWSNFGDGPELSVLACHNEKDEANKVLEKIRSERISQSALWSDFCVMYRSNWQGELFEQVLRATHIPYTVSGAKSFFDYSEIKDLLAYLQLVVNPKNDQAFLRIINKPVRKIGKKCLDKIIAVSKEKDLPFFEAIPWVKKNEILEPSWQSLMDFSCWIKSLSTVPPIEAFDLILQDTDYNSWLKLKADTPADAEKRWKRVMSFRSWISSVLKASEEVSLAGLLFKLQLSEQLSSDKDENAVSLTTVHAAKGLEFGSVFLSGFEEGLIPHKNSGSKQAFNEEVRIAYVAITRAKRSLTISYAKTRSYRGKRLAVSPSCFLKYIVEKKDNREKTLSKTEMFGRLREMLS